MGTNYIIDIINAKKKVTFIHDENIDWIYKIKDVFPKFDYYMCVSNSCKKILEEKYSYTKGKTVICRNIVDKEKVVKLSEVKCKEIFNPNIINFLTIGRLEYQKGYDLLLDVAEKLKQKNINFKWYIIGGGSLKSELELDIERRNLNDKVILCGIQKNPYNYLKECDYYVQTSRHEGYGIAIAEARILKKIVISTDIECVREQINNGENGILCKFEADDFLEKIIHLIKDKEYRLELQKKINNQEFNDNNDMDAFLRNVCKRKEG